MINYETLGYNTQKGVIERLLSLFIDEYKENRQTPDFSIDLTVDSTIEKFVEELHVDLSDEDLEELMCVIERTLNDENIHELIEEIEENEEDMFDPLKRLGLTEKDFL